MFSIRWIGLTLALLTAWLPAADTASDVYRQRRARLAEQMEDGALVLFGARSGGIEARFHQNHDFYYLGSYDPQDVELWEEACYGAGRTMTKDLFIRLYVAVRAASAAFTSASRKPLRTSRRASPPTSSAD